MSKSIFRQIGILFRSLFDRKTQQSDLDEEIQLHIEELTEQFIAEGKKTKAARKAALKRFGSVERVKDDTRDSWGIQKLVDSVRDFKFGLRLCAKHRSSSILAIVVLSIGIGVSTIIFTASTRLIATSSGTGLDERQIHIEWEIGLTNGRPISVQDFKHFENEIDSLENLIGIEYSNFHFQLPSADQEGKTYSGVRSTANLFDLTNEKPIRGRLTSDGDTDPGKPPSILISDLIWDDFFSRSDDAIGSRAILNGRECSIVGIMPKGFSFPGSQQIWMATDWLEFNGQSRSKSPKIGVVGRMKPEFELDQVRAELEGVATNLATQFPESNEDYTRFRLTPYREKFLGTESKVFLGLFVIASILTLLFACSNAFHIIMARTAIRSHELAVRCSLGAKRQHVIWHVVVDGLTLSGIGGLLGAGIAVLGLRIISDYLSVFDIPGLRAFELTSSAIIFILAASMFSGLCSSFIPAWRASKMNPHSILKDDSKSSSSIYIGWLSKTMIVSQVTFSTILLFVSITLIFPSIFVKSLEMPFDGSSLLSAQVNFRTEPQYQDPHDAATFYNDLKEKLVLIPGIEGTAATSGKFGILGDIREIEIEDQTFEGLLPNHLAQQSWVSPDYLEAYGMEPLSGRMLNEFDTKDSLAVCVINARFQKTYFAQEIPIGKRIKANSINKKNADWLTIVGVIPDTLPELPALTPTEREMTNKVTSGIFTPLSQGGPWSLNILLKAQDAGNPQYRQALRKAIMEIAPRARIQSSILTHEERLNIVSRIISTISMAGKAFGSVILLISIIGLYSIISFTTSQRRKEFGIRIAVGSSNWGIAKTVLKPWSITIGAGLLLGGLACVILMALVSTFGEMQSATETDFLGIGITLFPVSAIVAIASLLSMALPAWRAVKIAPMEVIRVE